VNCSGKIITWRRERFGYAFVLICSPECVEPARKSEPITGKPLPSMPKCLQHTFSRRCPSASPADVPRRSSSTQSSHRNTLPHRFSNRRSTDSGSVYPGLEQHYVYPPNLPELPHVRSWLHPQLLPARDCSTHEPGNPWKSPQNTQMGGYRHRSYMCRSFSIIHHNSPYFDVEQTEDCIP